MIRNGMKLYGAACSVLLAAAIVSPSGYADDICAGSIDGSVIRPLRHPIAVSLVTPDSPDPNAALVQRFLSGVQNAGLNVMQSGQGNTILNTSFIVTDSIESGLRSTAGTNTRAYNGFGWMSGVTVPDNEGRRIRGSALSMTIEATDVASQSLAWVGTIQCIVLGDDVGALAEDLGTIVGRSLGKSIKAQAF